jgi:hypothetical protein
MVGGTSFPPQDSKSEPWSNEQKTKATPKPKPSTKGKSKPEARTLAGSGIATGSLEVSLDNADTVIEGAPSNVVLFDVRWDSTAMSRVGFFCIQR